jgi:hypothetical protein
MKKLSCAVMAAIFFYLCQLSTVQAQTNTDKTSSHATSSTGGYSNAISVDPIRLIFGSFDASYELRMGQSNSLVIFGNYWNISGLWSAFGFGASYRWYIDVSDISKINKGALEGFSVGPAVSVGFWSWTGASFYDPYGVLSSYSGGASINIGGSAAYKWVFGGGWFVEPNVGIMFPISHPTGFSGFNVFGLGAGVGYAWK